jgi:hypothetical protein
MPPPISVNSDRLSFVGKRAFSVAWQVATANSSLSFLSPPVNTKLCGAGYLKATAVYDDHDQTVPVRVQQLETFIFRIKFFPPRAGLLHIRIYHVVQDSIPRLNSQRQALKKSPRYPSLH